MMITQIAKSDKGTKKKKKKDGPKKRRNHDHLNVKEVDVDLPEDQKKCPYCGNLMSFFRSG